MQAGKNRHEDICESLELFGTRVLPEFKERDEARGGPRPSGPPPVWGAAPPPPPPPPPPRPAGSPPPARPGGGGAPRAGGGGGAAPSPAAPAGGAPSRLMAATGSDLAGRVALVTGGGSGIGAAVSRRLAAEGCRVVVADLDGDGAKAVAEEVGGRALVMDVGDVAAWGPAVDGIVEEEGGLDIAHLNAGVATGEVDITRLTDDQYQRVLGANLNGVVYGAQAVARAMAAGARRVDRGHRLDGRASSPSAPTRSTR